MARIHPRVCFCFRVPTNQSANASPHVTRLFYRRLNFSACCFPEERHVVSQCCNSVSPCCYLMRYRDKGMTTLWIVWEPRLKRLYRIRYQVNSITNARILAIIDCMYSKCSYTTYMKCFSTCRSFKPYNISHSPCSLLLLRHTDTAYHNTLYTCMIRAGGVEGAI